MRRIIQAFTDTDAYKLTMAYAIVHCFPRSEVRYEFIDRNNTIYPEGFANLCNEQVKMLEDLHLTEEEEAFMKKKCYYIPTWFYTYLRGFRYRADKVVFKQDKEGHLSLIYSGNWGEFVLYEVQLLAIVSELYHEVRGDLKMIDYNKYYDLTYDKGTQLFNNGLTVAEFGTRRRLSYKAQEMAVKALKNAYAKCTSGGRLSGTSNVYLAMKYDLTPIGTHAHEWVASIAGFYGPQEANYIAMQKWQEAYDGNLGIFLYDTYTFKAFENNFSKQFARAFDGLRVDSGDNDEQRDLLCAKYESLGIDPKTKTIMFSNALTTKEAINLYHRSKDKCHVGFGIGGHLSCDGSLWSIPSANIVIKVTASRITESREWNETCKMSEDKGKFCGTLECYNTFKRLLHI